MRPTDEYVLKVGESDFKRMSLLSDLYMPFNTSFLMKAGLETGMHVADVGCGPGLLSCWMGQQVGKNGKVTCIDNDEAQLSLARQMAQELGVERNLEFVLHDARQLDELHERFDLVVSRFILVHMSKPIQMIASMRSILNDRGILVLAELDNATWSCYPPNTHFTNHTEILLHSGDDREVDFRVGRELYGYAHRLGYHVSQTSIDVPVLASSRERNYPVLKIEAYADEFETSGLASRESIRELCAELTKIANNPSFLLSGPLMYQVACRF